MQAIEYKKAIKLFCLFLLLILILVLITLKTAKCQGLKCINSTNLDNFSIKEVYEESSKNFRALYQKEEYLLRLEIISDLDQGEAEKQTQSKLLKVKNVFDSQLSPYPGELSNEIACDVEFKPEFQSVDLNGQKINYFSGYLNDRLQFGACTKNQVKYRGLVAYFYCIGQKKMVSN